MIKKLKVDNFKIKKRLSKMTEKYLKVKQHNL